MFCKKCGSSINDEASFCPKCGAAVKTAADQAVSEQKNQAIPPINMVAPDLNEGNAAQGTQGRENAPGASAQKIGEAASEAIDGAKNFIGKIGSAGSGDKQGGMKKALLIAGIAAVMALVLVVVNGARINNFVHRTFSSPKAYYQWVEKKTVKELAANAGEWYDGYIYDSLNFYDKSIEGGLAVELGEDGQEFIGLLGLAGVDLSWLRSMSVGADMAIKDNTAAIGASFSLNGSDIISGKAVMDMEKDMAYYQIPELNEKYVGVDLSDYEDDYEYSYGYGFDEDVYRYSSFDSEFQEINRKLLKACPDQAEVEKLMKKYMLLALSCVDDVSKSKDILKVEGVEQKCTVLKVTIDSDTLQDMAEAVLTQMRDDKDIKAIMKKVLEAGGEEDVEDVYEEFQDAIDDALDELEYLSYVDAKITMKVYVDGKGDIKGRTIDFGTIKISRLMPEKGSKFGYELSGRASGVTVMLVGSGRRSGDTITGDFSVKYNGASLVNITAKKLDTEDLKAGMLNGRIELEAASKLGNVVGMVPGLSIIEDMRIVMDFQSSRNSSKCKVGFIYDDQDIGSIAVSLKTGNGSKASIPAAKNTIMIEDREDLEDWLDGIRFDKLINSLKKADVPSRYMDVLEDVEDIDDLEDALDELFYYYY